MHNQLNRQPAIQLITEQMIVSEQRAQKMDGRIRINRKLIQ